MWTRGKDPQHPGRFAYELFTASGALIERVGGFDTAQAADRAAERAQRMALDFGAITPPLDASMTDAELLAALTEEN